MLCNDQTAIMSNLNTQRKRASARFAKALFRPKYFPWASRFTWGFSFFEKLPTRRRRYDSTLDAERTSTATGALYVRVVEFETRALESLHVVDRDSFEVHFAHLVHKNLQAVELIDIVRGIFLVLESHVIAEARAASAHNGHSQGHGCRILLAHNFLNFGRRYWGNSNHLSIFTP